MITMPLIPLWLMALVGIVLVALIVVKNKNVFSIFRRVVVVVLLFLISLRIMVPTENALVEVTANNLDVLFVVDSTISMLAEDYGVSTPRMDAVKADCKYIIEKLNGASFCVMTFNNTAQVLTPYTRDIAFVNGALDSIKIVDEIYARGSSLNVAKDETLHMLQSASLKGSDAASIVFFISDGEITNEDALKSFMETQQYINNGAVLGYGTQQGGRMRVKSVYSETESYLKDGTVVGRPDAVSKLDEDNLKTLSKDMGIDYIHMEKQSDVDAKLKDIEQNVLKNTIYKTKNGYAETYYLFVLPIVCIMAYELFYYRRRLIT